MEFYDWKTSTQGGKVKSTFRFGRKSCGAMQEFHQHFMMVEQAMATDKARNEELICEHQIELQRLL